MERMEIGDREDGKAKEGAQAGRRVAWEALTTPGRTDDLSGLLLALEQIAHGLLHRAGATRGRSRRCGYRFPENLLENYFLKPIPK